MPLIDLENLRRFKENLDTDVDQKIKEVDDALTEFIEETNETFSAKADLDENNIVPVAQIPSSAFDVVDCQDYASFPAEGSAGKIYVDRSQNILYRWDELTSDYVAISAPNDSSVLYTEQSLNDDQKRIARQNIGAISADEIEIPEIDGYVTTEEFDELESRVDATEVGIDELSSYVKNVNKIDGGIQIVYGGEQDSTKDITLETSNDFPLKAMEYTNNYLHLYDDNNNDLVEPVLIEGGGGGGSGSSGSLLITRVNDESFSVLYGKEALIEYTVVSKDSDDSLGSIRSCTISVGSIVVARNAPASQTSVNSFDIGPYLVADSTNIVKITVTADVGTESLLTRSKTWSITTVNLGITWRYDDTQINTSDYLDRWTVRGNISKDTHTTVTNVITGATETLPTINESRNLVTQSITIPFQGHGAFGVEHWVTAVVNGKVEPTPHEYHEMIFVDPTSDQPIISVPIRDFSMTQYSTFTLPFIVYNPKSIISTVDFYVDDVKVDTMQDLDRGLQTWYYTPTFGDEDNHVLSIVCGEEGKETSRDFDFTVEKVNIGDVVEVPGYTFRLKASEFSSNQSLQDWASKKVVVDGRIVEEDAVVYDKDNNEIAHDPLITFSDNFDWINGGLKTEYDDSGKFIQQYLCIKAGTRMIVNYQPLKDDPKNTGFDYKMVFKTVKCRNYDTEIARCIPRTTDEETQETIEGSGFVLNAYDASFKVSGVQKLNSKYCEDEIIDIEFEIYQTGQAQDYTFLWVDGVMSSFAQYSNDRFTNDEKITFGSDDCDLYIYAIKVYPNQIDIKNHVDNFIVDAPNSGEMKKRYDRNNILEGSSISWDKLANNNPDCRVWLYKVPFMTVTKSQKVDGCTFKQIWKGGDEYYQLDGVGTMSVQGTSSQDYVVGAANTDINFAGDGGTLFDGYGNNLIANGVKAKDEEKLKLGNNLFLGDSNKKIRKFTVLDAQIEAKLRKKYTVSEALNAATVQDVSQLGDEWVVYETDDDNNVISYINSNEEAEGELGPEWVVYERDSNRNPIKYVKALGFKIHDDSCPITYSNTKVNFASCEQVNNMCNAIWYQRFNPYQSMSIRDSMDFAMGVQFVCDEGAQDGVPDEGNFVLWGDNQYHLYSIANMGNSKKNVHIFHDVSNFGNEVCVEICDNDEDQQRMLTDDFSTEDWGGKVFYGMRYPDTDEKTSALVDPWHEAWYDLVRWMADRNPFNYNDEEELPAPETYEPYTFRGHNRPGTQVLRGTTVSEYAGTYTHNTFNRRMARMLSECEDHMVMDSFVYHYLYILRHTMMDNVAKNTFWSTSDLQHWDLSKAYDMDTSDGNNNNGAMVFDYGCEYDDDVFNAPTSVWFRFIANLNEACRTMFRNREALGAWSAKDYHRFLLSEQQRVPERCWNECYWRSYVRTLGLGKNWIRYLASGQKTHQRNHYETFQELYMSSKFDGSAVSGLSNIVTLRANSPTTYKLLVTAENGASLRRTGSSTGRVLKTVPKDTLLTIVRNEDGVNSTEWRQTTYDGVSGYIHINQLSGVEPTGLLRVKMFNKMYVGVETGTTSLAPKKVEKGDFVTFDLYANGAKNNAVIRIHAARMLQEVKGLETMYGDQFNFSNAIRLRELQIGSASAGYENNYFDGINLSNNTMLEKLYAQNLTKGDLGNLNLDSCPELIYIDATGSNFTGYTFANGGRLEEAILENPTAITLRNLSYLEDNKLVINNFSRLSTLFIENTDAMVLENKGVDIIRLVQQATALAIIRFIRFNWILQNVDLLNKMLDLKGLSQNATEVSQSVLVGNVYIPVVRQRNLDEYAAAWGNDLKVEYGNRIDEFLITFKNEDGTSILNKNGQPYTQYVDQGKTIIDPYEQGLIDTPTQSPTDQYEYVFDGWKNITGVVNEPRTVVAQYTQTLRTYRVRWIRQLKPDGTEYADNEQGAIILKVQENVPYGTEAKYEDDTHLFPPKITEYEDDGQYYVFTRWNKSTGYIRGDTDVYAIWDIKGLPSTSLNLKDMSVAQIYGIAKTNHANEYFEDEDYIDIQVGHDFNFSNVESRVLLENRYFDGNEVLKFEDLKLFSADAPTFTLAIDYEYADNTSGTSLVCCCDSNTGADGFKMYFLADSNTTNNQGIRILWGDKNDTVAHGQNRGVVVLSHAKGSNNLVIASDNGGRRVYHANYYYNNYEEGSAEYRYDAYNDNIYHNELVRSTATVTDSYLAFGAVPVGTQGYRDAAKGWIHWAKIWFDNLGADAIDKLVAWPHETWRMQYRGNGLYNKADGTGNFDGASFIMKTPLPQHYEMYNGNTTGGWKNSKMRTFLNTRCLKALPFSWQSIISPVTIATRGGADNYENLEYSNDKIFLPAYADMMAVSTGLEASEGRQISWFTDNVSRIKFMGISVPDNRQFITTQNNEDPTLYETLYHVKEGDIWYADNRYYIYVSEDTASKHFYIGGRLKSSGVYRTAQGPNGGLWVSAYSYHTRTTAGSSSDRYYIVTNTGTVSSNYSSSDYNRRGIVLMFSL